MPGISNNSRVSVNILDAHLRKLTEPIYVDNPLMAMLKSKNRIVMKGKGVGKTLKWRVRYKRRTINAGPGVNTTYTFTPHQTKKLAELDWRNYWLTESYTKFEELISTNPETALGDITEEVMTEAMEDFRADFPLKFFNDGNVSGNRGVHGVESFMSYSGTVTNGLVGDPNDVYAGLYTTLGYYGGTWTPPSSQGWPIPTDSGCASQYHFWSPMVVDYTNALWNAGTKTWINTWSEALRFAVTYQKIIQDAKVDLFYLHPELERDMKDSLTAKETFEITANSELVRLGFPTLNFEGTEVLSGYGLPGSTGYGLSWDNIELRSLQDQLVATDSDEDLVSLTKRMLFDFYGNYRFESPAKFVKLINAT